MLCAQGAMVAAVVLVTTNAAWGVPPEVRALEKSGDEHWRAAHFLLQRPSERPSGSLSHDAHLGNTQVVRVPRTRNPVTVDAELQLGFERERHFDLPSTESLA